MARRWASEKAFLDALALRQTLRVEQRRAEAAAQAERLRLHAQSPWVTSAAEEQARLFPSSYPTKLD